MSLEGLTLCFLIFVFLAVEFYVAKRGLDGKVIAFADENPLTKFADRKLRVRLSNGAEVVAAVSGCTSCMARFVPGDPVVLVRHSGGYTVTVPWLKPRCTKSEEGRCHA